MAHVPTGSNSPWRFRDNFLMLRQVLGECGLSLFSAILCSVSPVKYGVCREKSSLCFALSECQFVGIRDSNSSRHRGRNRLMRLRHVARVTFCFATFERTRQPKSSAWLSNLVGRPSQISFRLKAERRRTAIWHLIDAVGYIGVKGWLVQTRDATAQYRFFVVMG